MSPWFLLLFVEGALLVLFGAWLGYRRGWHDGDEGHDCVHVAKFFAKSSTLYWRSSKCNHAEALQDDDPYEVGDSEPCTHCAELDCVATVERGEPVVEVVGSSPAHEYEPESGDS